MSFTWKQARRAIAPELGRHAILTTTSSGNTAATTLVCSGLINANAEPSRFEGFWLLGTEAPILGQQAQLLNGAGYAKTSGTLTLASALSTQVPSGIDFELFEKMPAIATDENFSIQQAVNNTLAAAPPIALLSITGVTGQVAYDLTTLYPWLTEKSQIIALYEQPAGALRPMQSGKAWDWCYNLDAPRLEILSGGYNTGETFYLKVHQPAKTWIKTSGTWGASTVGLTADADEALGLLPYVKAASLAECYRMLGARPGPDAYRDFYREREHSWLTEAAQLCWWDGQKSDEERRPQFTMVYSGAPLGTSRGYRTN